MPSLCPSSLRVNRWYKSREKVERNQKRLRYGVWLRFLELGIKGEFLGLGVGDEGDAVSKVYCMVFIIFYIKNYILVKKFVWWW
jgi:hypothetical protein